MTTSTVYVHKGRFLSPIFIFEKSGAGKSAIYNFKFLLAASLFKCVAPFSHPRSTFWLSAQLETVSLALLRICSWDRLQPQKSRDGAWSDWFCAITQSADLNFTHCIYCIWLHLWLTYICSKISTISATVVQNNRRAKRDKSGRSADF